MPSDAMPDPKEEASAINVYASQFAVRPNAETWVRSLMARTLRAAAALPSVVAGTTYRAISVKRLERLAQEIETKP